MRTELPEFRRRGRITDVEKVVHPAQLHRRAAVAAVMNSTPMFPELRSAIAQRAREIWLSRGTPSNQDLDIWLEAEREILPRYQALERSQSLLPTHRPKKSAAADEIDESELADRLSDFGDPGRRSPTSVEPT